MSGTGLPILISRNCVRASKNASRTRFAGKYLAGTRLAHTQKVSYQKQQGCGHQHVSYCCNALQMRPISTSTLQDSVGLFKSLCAIKHPRLCQKNCKLLLSQVCPSSNVTKSSTVQVPSSFHHFYNSEIQARAVQVGARSLCSKQDPPSGTKSDSKTDPSSLAEAESNEEGIPKEAPLVIKLGKPSKDGGKVEVITAKSTKVSDAPKIKEAEPEAKPYKLRRKKVDYSKKHTENITITALRAMKEYLLKPEDLKQLRQITRRTPYDTNPNEPPLQVYLRRDVEEKAIEVWGSREALKREETARMKLEYMLKDQYFLHRQDVKDSEAFVGPQAKEKPSGFFASSGSHVVFSAICINAANFVCKLVAWAYSGSASVFSEAIHSAADTLNQLILAWGIHSATKRPSKDHPYGFATLTYVSSLISGVGIFCVGAGLAFYHGIMGLIHPEPIESLYWTYCVLAGALCSEGATLMVAIDAIRKGAKAKKMTFFEYVWRSRNPSVNVVFLEDAAAVIGVIVAGSCIGLTSVTGNPMYDSIGSIAVGGILAAVSGFLVYTNTEALVGRSIPEDQLIKINDMLVNDPVVRGVYDIKATDMGVGLVRFKAEIDFDGREVTRAYLDTQDPDMLLKSVKTLQTSEELETFMLIHGEKGIDMLGSQVDRLEKEIKKLNPEVRHVDLEIL